MADEARAGHPERTRRLTLVIAQVLLVAAAGALWAASRLPWVVVRSFDGLGPPRDMTLSGASWSTALVPLAVLMLAAAIAPLAVRGWPLRLLAGLLALAGLAAGYLGIGLWALPDVAARGADLAHVPLTTLVGSERRYAGAGLAIGAPACAVLAAIALVRSARIPATIRRPVGAADATAQGPQTPQMSERMIWDALDEGRDPTVRPGGPDTEGR